MLTIVYIINFTICFSFWMTYPHPWLGPLSENHDPSLGNPSILQTWVRLCCDSV